MPDIQVDMFEVQLGAALLLQFKLTDSNGKNKIVHVLADAGVDNASGYHVDRVRDKLFDATNGNATDVWLDVPPAIPRLELIIGTHYDADHLRGLVPIIEKDTLEIDEIWLPPVQDDAGVVSIVSVAGGEAALVQRMLVHNEDEVLAGYLGRRQAQIEEVDAMYREPGLKELARGALEKPEVLDEPYFKMQLDLANARLGAEDQHGHADETHGAEDSERLVEAIRQVLSQGDVFNVLALSQPDTLALEMVRKSAASDAITASNLNAVVKAIKARNQRTCQKIRVCSEAIDAGLPRYFHWDGACFCEQAPEKVLTGLGFHLMAPSRGLIADLQPKIPVGTLLLAMRKVPLASGTVTPSNRLSYVMRFHLDDQAILVTGDAGFTDFCPPRTTAFYQPLLDLLKPLHVVQVAHHGGMNHRFYEALDAAGQPQQGDRSFLLLSHATHDATRPRAEFARYVGQFQTRTVSVLFTAKPKRSNATLFSAHIHAVTPPGPKALAGDVRLSFSGGAWQVDKHSVEI